MKSSKNWVGYVIISVIFSGVWGAFIEIPEKNGFPSTLGYIVWALTMIPASLIALWVNKWKLEFNKTSIIYGSLIGFLGAAGQLILFLVLKSAPAYLVFPILALTPLVTILLSVIFLKEKASRIGWVGIFTAIVALLLLSYQPPSNHEKIGYTWILLTILVLVGWGTQGFIMRFANASMKAESIFFYMMITALMLIPIALWMTDFSQPINWGFDGPYLAGVIQILNSFGSLFLVYAFRYGKAIIVAPMATALSPVLTVVISLVIYAVLPHPVIISGILLAVFAALLMGMEDSQKDKLVEKPVL